MGTARALAASILVLASAAAPGSFAQALLPAGDWRWTQGGGGEAALEYLPGQALPGEAEPAADALRMAVRKPSEPFYLIMASKALGAPVREGDRLALSFWARSPTGNALRAIVEESGAPYAESLSISPALGPAWTRYAVEGVAAGHGSPPSEAPRDLALSLRFQAGFKAGVVELAGIRVEDLGPDPALAAAREAIAPAAVAGRIRRYRMGELSLLVKDARGDPVPGASVHVAQQSHAFLFGCNIFLLQPGSSDPIQKAYQARFQALFNYATLPFYWSSYEAAEGRTDAARLEAMARWCLARGITPKGHPLVWHESWPSWAPKSAEAAIPLLKRRIDDIIPRFDGLIRYWDVQNEANSSAAFPKTGLGDWVRRDGPAAVVGTTLSWARGAAAGRDDCLIYNDFSTGPDNLRLLSELASRSSLPDAIGIQAHMHRGTWPLARVWATAEEFAAFGVPLHCTETTVLSGPLRDFDYARPPKDWPGSPEGEAGQADYVEGLYSILFSHPALRAITWWDLSDRGAWLNAPAGLLRKDMKPKPAYERLLRLIKGAWWTDEAGVTGADGSYGLRAFYGDYLVTATGPSGATARTRLSFPEASPPRLVELRLP
jgi:endo-1,4-beta-xylanase